MWTSKTHTSRRVVQMFCCICIQWRTNCTTVAPKSRARWWSSSDMGKMTFKSNLLQSSDWINMILNTDIIIFYIQDYHVFFMHNPSPNRCLVFDLDTTLPFPTYFHKYVTETFRSDLALRPEHHRYLNFLNIEKI